MTTEGSEALYNADQLKASDLNGKRFFVASDGKANGFGGVLDVFGAQKDLKMLFDGLFCVWFWSFLKLGVCLFNSFIDSGGCVEGVNWFFLVFSGNP